ncbi:hypothetical protein [Sorangium sp. So ce1024]|uniref:hypothetical protein n=1 Tax=unclassified Sorangium TaxID=2621164 RepID=UPI003F04530E
MRSVVAAFGLRGDLAVNFTGVECGFRRHRARIPPVNFPEPPGIAAIINTPDGAD